MLKLKLGTTGRGGGGTSISDTSGTCLPLVSPFSKKFQNRVENFGKNFETGVSKTLEFSRTCQIYPKGSPSSQK